MKKLFLGIAMVLFIGSYTVSALTLSNKQTPPQDKTKKTECKASAGKSGCCKSTEKKDCGSAKATASTEKKTTKETVQKTGGKCCKDKATASANTK